MMIEFLKFLTWMAYILLVGIIGLSVAVIILAMCAVASDADEKTEEWMKNNEGESEADGQKNIESVQIVEERDSKD